MAQKLSCVQATDGEETSHGDGGLHLRQVRLEGLTQKLLYCMRLIVLGVGQFPQKLATAALSVGHVSKIGSSRAISNARVKFGRR